MGYALHENALHKGFATEAVLALSAYVFEHWAFDELYANARVENGASRAVLERAGFVYLDTRLTLLNGDDEETLCAWYVKRK